MNIIEERDARLIRRKIQKQKYDELITLSAPTQTVRLLDEGMVVDGNGAPWFYIMKGTIKAFYDSLPSDYEGSINIGHTDLASFPERLVGRWTKDDLTLVDTGDGRMGLDVDLHLQEEHPLVIALRMAPYDLAVSVEMKVEINEDISKEYGFEFVDGIFIHDFAIVGEPANVNSTVSLKGEKMDIRTLLAKEGEPKDLTELNAKLDELLEKDLSVEEVTEEVEEVAEEELSVEEEVSEEESEEEVEASAEEEEEEDEVSLDSLNSALDELQSTIDGLEARISELEGENTSLKADLKARMDAEEAFLNKFKKLGVSLSTERTKPETKTEKVVFTDGFGG